MAYLRSLPDGTMAQLPAGSAQLGDFGWVVKTPVSPEAHEVITRNAVGGGTISFTVAGRPMSRTLSPAEQNEIVEGVRSVDLGWAGTGVLFSLNPGEQKRHALRASYGQSQTAALSDILGSLRSQHTGVLAETNPTKQLRLIGQVLHLIQDSFSPAHIERRPGSSWCVNYIRNFGRGSHPTEHRTPSDDRDRVTASPTEAAQATAFSRQYLQIVFKAIYGRTRSDAAAISEASAEFARFANGLLVSCSRISTLTRVPGALPIR